jgi:hypothetical protein
MSAKGEGPYAAYGEIQQIVQNYLMKHPHFNCVFVTSDEKDFIDHMQRILDFIPVIFTEKKEYAKGELPAFRTDLVGGDPYLKSEEALIDCLLLSRVIVPSRQVTPKT